MITSREEADYAKKAVQAALLMSSTNGDYKGTFEYGSGSTQGYIKDVFVYNNTGINTMRKLLNDALLGMARHANKASVTWDKHAIHDLLYGIMCEQQNAGKLMIQNIHKTHRLFKVETDKNRAVLKELHDENKIREYHLCTLYRQRTESRCIEMCNDMQICIFLPHDIYVRTAIDAPTMEDVMSFLCKKRKADDDDDDDSMQMEPQPKKPLHEQTFVSFNNPRAKTEWEDWLNDDHPLSTVKRLLPVGNARVRST